MQPMTRLVDNVGHRTCRLFRALLAALSLSLLASRGLAGVGADDFVTGGGWITGTPSGARANFGFKGGSDASGATFGHLNYVDHDAGLHVKSTSITGYVIVDAITREISGTAEADGASVTFVLTVSDAGEPGRADTFELTLSDGYTASGTLQGGNVQLHD